VNVRVILFSAATFKERRSLVRRTQARAVPAVLCLCTSCSILAGTLLAFFHLQASANVVPRTLTFADRVAYQRAIEEVYWRHRIWPKENPNPKPPLQAVMSQAQLEKKVADYLRNSQALEDYWQQPLTAEQLQAEMDRMAQHTRQPEVLRELFESLGNDPFVIAECLARPALAERPTADLSAQNKTNHAQSSRISGLGGMSMATTSGSGGYTLPKISEGDPPCTDDTWTATSTTNAPSPRDLHTAVWTGTEMIVWGGVDPNYLNTGGKYNPSTDSWTATSTANAPTARSGHKAVWTGSEMIVWGGVPFTYPTGTGGRYNPITDSWTATSTSNAPSTRNGHTAVWTGSEMIIWGGVDFIGRYWNTGGKYNPSTDSWTATSTANAPTARSGHKAVWTGSEMIVWGGVCDGASCSPPVTLNTGGRYNPSTDSWTTTSITNAPSARFSHTAVLAGSEMIIWGGFNASGGYFNTGGRYNPSMDSWTATSTTNAPTGRERHTAILSGNGMIVWGGYDGTNALNTGGRYDPGTDSWTATSTTNAPSARAAHTAVWTNSEMVVWGGGSYLNTGGRYCAAASSPTPTPTPSPTPTATATITPSPTPTPSLTPRATPISRPRPTPAPRP
jgi:N-acetylneuraminic acid mutarotase